MEKNIVSYKKILFRTYVQILFLIQFTPDINYTELWQNCNNKLVKEIKKK